MSRSQPMGVSLSSFIRAADGLSSRRAAEAYSYGLALGCAWPLAACNDVHHAVFVHGGDELHLGAAPVREGGPGSGGRAVWLRSKTLREVGPLLPESYVGLCANKHAKAACQIPGHTGSSRLLQLLGNFWLSLQVSFDASKQAEARCALWRWLLYTSPAAQQ